MSNCCVCQLGKVAKRPREEEEAASVDRLSYLPDVILHHIFSFLDAKYVVQTSVLSRLWRCVWKHAPVLNFRRDSFRGTQSFIRFVNMVFARRYQLGICKISFVDGSALWRPRYKDMFGKVMNYASFHGTQHLIISLNLDCALSDSFGSILRFNVETLELKGVPFPNGFGSSSFQKLTTLNLEGCELLNDQQGVFDLISNFPCLMNLVISGCHWFLIGGYETIFSTKIIGPQLRSLNLDMMYNYTEIVAPRLEFLNLKFSVENYFEAVGNYVEDYQGFSKLSIPSLVHADIVVLESFLRYNKEKMEHYLDNLFQGLYNAKSLVIRSDDDQALKEICTYVKQNQSSFTRLKSFESKKLPKAMKKEEQQEKVAQGHRQLHRSLKIYKNVTPM
ncbi:FBD-associated F-box protein At5g18780 [Linum perenne]